MTHFMEFINDEVEFWIKDSEDDSFITLLLRSFINYHYVGLMLKREHLIKLMETIQRYFEERNYSAGGVCQEH